MSSAERMQILARFLRSQMRTEIGQIERLISSEIRPHYLQVYEAEANKLRATLDAMNSYLGLDNETVI